MSEFPEQYFHGDMNDYDFMEDDDDVGIMERGVDTGEEEGAGAGAGPGATAAAAFMPTDPDDLDDMSYDDDPGEHEDADALLLSSTKMCRHFARGKCTFGRSCRFSHVEFLDQANPSSNRQTNSPVPVPSTSSSSPQYMRRTDCSSKKSARNRHISSRHNNRPNNWINAPEFVPQSQKFVNYGDKYYGQSSQIEAQTEQPSYLYHYHQRELEQQQQQQQQPQQQQHEQQQQQHQHQHQQEQGQQEDLSTIDGRSYAEVARVNLASTSSGENVGASQIPFDDQQNDDYSNYELCTLCGLYCLHPTNNEQRRLHNSECISEHEKNMELSFAVARSKDKTCGICFEIVLDKSGREKRFGILPNCNHTFCLECIRKWRKSKQFDNKIIRACPECRVSSDFVCPSEYWVESADDKIKLLNEYKVALGIKDCKYFKQGYGKCPFGNKCFYKHALPNGNLVDVGLPQRRVRRYNTLGDVEFLQAIFLRDFVEDRYHQWIDDLATFLSDTDSEFSDYDVLDVVFS